MIVLSRLSLGTGHGATLQVPLCSSACPAHRCALSGLGVHSRLAGAGTPHWSVTAKLPVRALPVRALPTSNDAAATAAVEGEGQGVKGDDAALCK